MDDVVSQAREAGSAVSGVTSAWPVAYSIGSLSKCRRKSGSRSCRSRFGRRSVRSSDRNLADSSGRSSSDRNWGRNFGRSFGRKIGCSVAAGCCCKVVSDHYGLLCCTSRRTWARAIA